MTTVRPTSLGLTDGEFDGSYYKSYISITGDSVTHFRYYRTGKIDTTNAVAIKKGLLGHVKLVDLPNSDTVEIKNK